MMQALLDGKSLCGDISGISLQDARVCAICWVIHVMDDCPDCGARQWHGLTDMMEIENPEQSRSRDAYA
jgi:hypothetical protein